MSYHAGMSRAIRHPPNAATRPYTNRRGDTYYLHQGLTKTGKPRYFAARAVGDGALATMPDGFEFTESINGVVSVARKGRDVHPVPPADLELVQVEQARHDHLSAYKVAPLRGDIVVYQPLGGMPAAVLPMRGPVKVGTPAYLRQLAELRAQALLHQKFDPVFKFMPATDAPGVYLASRMSYRGQGGWLDLRAGPLTRLARQYIRLLGTDELFEEF